MLQRGISSFFSKSTLVGDNRAHPEVEIITGSSTMRLRLCSAMLFATASMMGREKSIPVFTASGQMSVLDYITVLRRKVKAENDLLLLQTNRQLATTAYNYWNW